MGIAVSKSIVSKFKNDRKKEDLRRVATTMELDCGTEFVEVLSKVVLVTCYP